MGYLSCRSHLSVATSDPNKAAAAASSFSGSNSSRNLAVKEFEYSDLEAATAGFSNQKLLGRGSHGAVYKATLHNSRRVAIKRSSSQSPMLAWVEVENEIDILFQIWSPWLVNLVGFTPAATSDNHDWLLVVEFVKKGTLHSAPNLQPWPCRLRLALQTAKAILTLRPPSSTPRQGNGKRQYGDGGEGEGLTGRGQGGKGDGDQAARKGARRRPLGMAGSAGSSLSLSSSRAEPQE